MRVNVAFGKTGLAIDLPDGFHYRVLEAHAAVTLADALQAVEQALDAPLGTASISELALGKKSAAISVCDITRPAPNRLVLPPLLARLEAAGIARAEITILIATGLHRPAPASEIEEIVGGGHRGDVPCVESSRKGTIRASSPGSYIDRYAGLH